MSHDGRSTKGDIEPIVRSGRLEEKLFETIEWADSN